MEKLKIISYVFMAICTLITIITSIILITSGNYTTSFSIMMIVIFAWLSIYIQRISDSHGDD